MIKELKDVIMKYTSSTYFQGYESHDASKPFSYDLERGKERYVDGSKFCSWWQQYQHTYCTSHTLFVADVRRGRYPLTAEGMGNWYVDRVLTGDFGADGYGVKFLGNSATSTLLFHAYIKSNGKPHIPDTTKLKDALEEENNILGFYIGDSAMSSLHFMPIYWDENRKAYFLMDFNKAERANLKINYKGIYLSGKEKIWKDFVKEQSGKEKRSTWLKIYLIK